MKKTFILVLLSLLLLVLFSSCATVFKGTTQEITFETSPSGAKVYLDGDMVGTTPVTMPLKKNKYKSFRVELEGYQTIQRQMDKEYDLVALLNIFWDYSTTDMLTGAAFEYAKNAYYIELQKK
ncbi:MAG: PEGA domain-containing protein [Spirochaetaceae bacterium]|nr:PEGA domain-containing protein [Spirochaetaceae bacterium]